MTALVALLSLLLLFYLPHMMNPPCIELLWWLSGWSSIKQRHTPYVSVGGGVIIATHSLHSFTTLHMSRMCKYLTVIQATMKSVHFRQSAAGKLNLH